MYIVIEMVKRDEAVRFLPLKDAAFHILLSLADGPRHGYAIGTEVHARTNGAVRLWPTTLYGTIRQLTESRLIKPCDHEPGENDPRRRYYQLTALGKRVLAAEIERLRQLIEYARGTKALGEA
jgi:DNA-binding PadR family transcriptional regulator